MLQKNERQNSLLSLLLLVPAASIGIAMAVYIAPGTFGAILLFLSKVWLLALPLAWFFVG